MVVNLFWCISSLELMKFIIYSYVGWKFFRLNQSQTGLYWPSCYRCSCKIILIPWYVCRKCNQCEWNAPRLSKYMSVSLLQIIYCYRTLQIFTYGPTCFCINVDFWSLITRLVQRIMPVGPLGSLISTRLSHNRWLSLSNNIVHKGKVQSPYELYEVFL